MEEPEDVTGAVLFLTSDDAAFVTGQRHFKLRDEHIREEPA
jgi:hypothetical protein